MNAHKATRSRSRRRRPGPTRATAGRGGKGSWPVGLTAVAVLVLAGSAVAGWTSFPSATEGNAASDRTPGPSSVSSGNPSRRQPGHRATPGSAASASGPTAPSIPESGPGTFSTAPGTSVKVGRGKTLRYRVDIEDGLSLSAADVTAQVESILADRRGWTANGSSAFQRVSSGPTDFAVRVATPKTVDEICGRYGLDTGGELNCDVGRQVMVNLKRWLLATPVYAKDVTAYRALIINHEVGHFLGHGHVGCPGKGEPAPVMMQQIKGMHGCAPNVWPYDTHGRYITGPALR
ncbi:DUF3152 domain-containing protein [Streptomyces antibioticus]|uniref:DUF3152 domain-containing protein n=1 Tax=Streptomyces antibioticus TaxID=1890 RepID=UPI0033DBF5E2